MATLGQVALVAAFAVALLSAWVGAAAGITRTWRLSQLSRQLVMAMVGLIALAAVSLLYSFVGHDFTIAYVQGRADTRMPLGYLMAAFWGGQEGSLLFWVWVVAAFTGAASWLNRDSLPRLMPWFHALLSLLLAAFLFILVFVTNPFEGYAVIDAPVEGTGLKAALRDPLMMIHPPMLLGGFASFAIPWAFGMAALLSGDTSADWVRATRKWTLLSWLFLSLGNLLGGMWAYRELGWGGYWAWDPVENAGLLPWLTATAFLHSVIIQEQRGMLKRWNVSLVVITFLLTLFGTFLTRSGMIDSVHTFAESEIGDYFMWLFIGFTVLSISIAAYGWSRLRSEHQIESVASRESAFLANNWLLVGMTFVILWGTLFPKLKELITGVAVTIGPPWFNRFLAPLGMALLALMIIGTLLPWRKATARHLRSHFTFPIVGTIVLVPALSTIWWFWRGQHLMSSAFGYAQALALLGFTLIIGNTLTISSEFMRGIKARRRSGDKSIFTAVSDLLMRHRRRYGGYIVHMGIIMIFMAFMGNAVKADKQLTLQIGDTVSLGDYLIRFENFEARQASDHIAFTAIMGLYHDNELVSTLTPARADFNNYALLAGQSPDSLNIRSNIYIRSTPLEDVYVALLNFDEDGDSAAFKLVILPFTWWLWFGGFVLILGTMICLWPEDAKRRRMDWMQRSAKAVELGSIALLCLVPLALLFSSTDAIAAEAADHRPLEETVSYQAPGQDAWRAFDLIMTTCTGCAGKTISLASPNCHSSNVDKARIVELESAGMSLDQILDVFIEERGAQAVAIPPDDGKLPIHWMLPYALLAAALAGIAVLVRRWASSGRLAHSDNSDARDDDELSDEEYAWRADLQAELRR